MTDEPTTKRYALCVEKTSDPNPNWTMIGGSIELDVSEYDSERDARLEAARELWPGAPETSRDITGDFAVYEVSEPELFSQQRVVPSLEMED